MIHIFTLAFIQRSSIYVLCACELRAYPIIFPTIEIFHTAPQSGPQVGMHLPENVGH